MTQTLRRDRDLALSRLKYEMAAYRVRLSMLALDEALSAPEEKFNPNHDPANGRFTSGGGGSFGAAPGPPVAQSSILRRSDANGGGQLHGAGRDRHYRSKNSTTSGEHSGRVHTADRPDDEGHKWCP